MSVFDEDVSADAGRDVTQADVGTPETVEDPAALIAAANAKADENYSKFLLAMADFENYKRRMQRDIEGIVTHHRRTLLERFLPVIDNLERALQVGTADDGLRTGVEATLKGFEGVLAAENVRVIDVLDKPFDPKTAEAIGTVPAREGVADDTVVEVAQKGYTIGEELLRPARVIVATTAA
jgi:molecular chaperone GrpE